MGQVEDLAIATHIASTCLQRRTCAGQTLVRPVLSWNLGTLANPSVGSDPLPGAARKGERSGLRGDHG